MIIRYRKIIKNHSIWFTFRVTVENKDILMTLYLQNTEKQRPIFTVDKLPYLRDISQEREILS